MYPIWVYDVLDEQDGRTVPMTYDEALSYFTKRYHAGSRGLRAWFARRDAAAAVRAVAA